MIDRLTSVRTLSSWMLLSCMLLGTPPPRAPAAPEATVRVKARILRARPSAADASGVVVSLTPLGPAHHGAPAPQQKYRLLQKSKRFSPHLLLVPAGSSIEFPNADPFFHNVFSLFNGKRFDLGLYEAGSSRTIRFDRPGVSYIFCNIHPEMSAVVIAFDTPIFGVTNASGSLTLPGVAPGRYLMNIWYERATAEDLARLGHEIQVQGNSAPIELEVPEKIQTTDHKNKFGQDYEKRPATPY